MASAAPAAVNRRTMANRRRRLPGAPETAARCRPSPRRRSTAIPGRATKRSGSSPADVPASADTAMPPTPRRRQASARSKQRPTPPWSSLPRLRSQTRRLISPRPSRLIPLPWHQSRIATPVAEQSSRALLSSLLPSEQPQAPTVCPLPSRRMSAAAPADVAPMPAVGGKARRAAKRAGQTSCQRARSPRDASRGAAPAQQPPEAAAKLPSRSSPPRPRRPPSR